MNLLLVEDEQKLASILKKNLEEERYAVTVARDGESGLQNALVRNYALVILDLMLPKKDGVEICKELRRKKVYTPVLMLTARATHSDRVLGLDSGADDYMTKPFDMKELYARIRALLRRKNTEAPVELVVGDLVLNPATHEVRRGESSLKLSPKEYALLDYLMRYPGIAIERSRIALHVWGYDNLPRGNQLDVYIRHLRRKIDVGNIKKLIRTIRGVGYTIKA